MATAMPHTTVPGVSTQDSSAAVEVLDGRLVSLLDLSLTLKHVHWNVVGPMFKSVHEMLDEQVAPVRDMVDDVAERIRTLGGTPVGTPQAIVDRRQWSDYDVGRGSVMTHLRALDAVYTGIISDHREAIAKLDELDIVSQGMLIDQTDKLELFQWFVRSFLERVGDESDPTTPSPAVRAADERDSHAQGHADRPATDAEAASAERGAKDVDMESTSESYRDMAKIGATTEGEGRIS